MYKQSLILILWLSVSPNKYLTDTLMNTGIFVLGRAVLYHFFGVKSIQIEIAKHLNS